MAIDNETLARIEAMLDDGVCSISHTRLLLRDLKDLKTELELKNDQIKKAEQGVSEGALHRIAWGLVRQVCKMISQADREKCIFEALKEVATTPLQAKITKSCAKATDFWMSIPRYTVDETLSNVPMPKCDAMLTDVGFAWRAYQKGDYARAEEHLRHAMRMHSELREPAEAEVSNPLAEGAVSGSR